MQPWNSYPLSNFILIRYAVYLKNLLLHIYHSSFIVKQRVHLSWTLTKVMISKF